jgi:hypothetical protein
MPVSSSMISLALLAYAALGAGGGGVRPSLLRGADTVPGACTSERLELEPGRALGGDIVWEGVWSGGLTDYNVGDIAEREESGG